MLAMEEWSHADDRVIQRQYSEKVCMSCAWFTYGIDAHCHTCVGCALTEALLEQGLPSFIEGFSSLSRTFLDRYQELIPGRCT